MTINEKVYSQFPELIKLYRFEGASSLHHFNFNGSTIYNSIDSHYIYFSSNIKHHQYYCKKRVEKLINSDILEKDCKFKLSYKTLLNFELFKELVKVVENYPMDDKLISIEFSLSQMFEKMLDSNYINNRCKQSPDRRIERVDTTKHQGGYGFCGEWLELFNILTYFYSYQRITKENLLDFLYLYRKAVTSNLKVNPMNFLTNPRNRVIKINERLFYDFSKYELMNSLENIVDKGLYFKKSIFGEKPDDQIRNIIKKYSDEREIIIETFESEYQKKLTI